MLLLDATVKSNGYGKWKSTECESIVSLNTIFPTSSFINRCCLSNTGPFLRASRCRQNTGGEGSPSCAPAHTNHPLGEWGVRGPRAGSVQTHTPACVCVCLCKPESPLHLSTRVVFLPLPPSPPKHIPRPSFPADLLPCCRFTDELCCCSRPGVLKPSLEIQMTLPHNAPHSVALWQCLNCDKLSILLSIFFSIFSDKILSILLVSFSLYLMVRHV